MTLVVLDGHPCSTHGAFGIPALVTSVRDDRVLGLTLETGFDRLTFLGDFMMTFAIPTVKLAVTQTAILRGAGTAHIILTIKSTARFAASPLTGMIGSVVGVEPPFTVQAIIGTVHKSRKGRATIKMIIGFE